MTTHTTIIVGGGMAGMACALKLMQAGQDFLLVTDALGGRVRYSDEAGVNYGAYFVMANYVHARQILSQESLLNPLDVCFHNGEAERFSALSLHTLRRLPELVRFYAVMWEFSRHYETYKQRCLARPQKAALEADPYMAGLFAKPAAQFIRERHFEQAAADYVSKFAYACTGVAPEQLTALDFLNVSMGLVTPIHRFRFDRKAMAHKLRDHLVFDTITALEQKDKAHFLHGKSGKTYLAQNVVLATPACVTQQLLGLAEIRTACKLYVWHVQAQLKPEYRRYSVNLFPPTSEIMLTAREFDGSYLVYAREAGADLAQVCEQYSLLCSVAWEKAMYVQGRAYMEQEPGAGIYVAGDHNGLGLEPAAISGIFAANKIIGTSAEAEPII